MLPKKLGTWENLRKKKHAKKNIRHLKEFTESKSCSKTHCLKEHSSTCAEPGSRLFVSFCCSDLLCLGGCSVCFSQPVLPCSTLSWKIWKSTRTQLLSMNWSSTLYARAPAPEIDGWFYEYTLCTMSGDHSKSVGKEGCSNTKNEEVGQTQNYWLPPPNRNANIPEHPTTIHGASSRKVAYHPNTACFTPTIHRQVTASERYTLVKRITLRTTCSTYVGAPRIQIQHLTE